MIWALASVSRSKPSREVVLGPAAGMGHCGLLEGPASLPISGVSLPTPTLAGAHLSLFSGAHKDEDICAFL